MGTNNLGGVAKDTGVRTRRGSGSLGQSRGIVGAFVACAIDGETRHRLDERVGHRMVVEYRT